MLFLLACIEPRSSSVIDVVTPGDSGEASEVVEHCGLITADETWWAEARHLVSCDVEVQRGTLTVEATAEVLFAERAGLSVGVDVYEAGLVADGSAGGITFAAESDAGWDGVEIGPYAASVVLTGLSVRDATGGVRIQGAEVTLEGLGVEGADGACLTMTDGARFAEGAEGLVVTGCGDWGVSGEVGTAHTLPSTASAYTGNALDGVWLAGDTLDSAVTWSDLDVPYVVSDLVDVGGSAGDPAVLTLSPGVSVLFEQDQGMRFSRSGNASQLVADGTEEAPIVLEGLGANTAGYWRGIEVAEGASLTRLHNVEIRGAGLDGGAALSVDDADLLVNTLTISGSAGAGLELDGTARFGSGSNGLVVTDSVIALTLPPAAVASLPTVGLTLTDNDTLAVKITGGDAVDESGTWPDPGVPYWVGDDIEIDGTADAPAIVEIAAGVTLLFDNDSGIFVGKTGSAGLLVSGTAEAPVLMLPWSAEVPGAWSGIGIYDAAVDASVVFSHVEIGYAGGSVLRGNVHIVDATPTLQSVSLHDSLEWGVYVSGEQIPVTSDMTYADNASGTCNLCE